LQGKERNHFDFNEKEIESVSFKKSFYVGEKDKKLKDSDQDQIKKKQDLKKM